MKDKKSETPPLSRASRKMADAALAESKFKRTSDGKSAVRKFEVHGMVVTEQVSVADVVPASSPPFRSPVVNVAPTTAPLKDSVPRTPPLTRQGRKVADATLAAAKFTPTSDGKSAIRQFEVHGMAVTEYVSAETAADSIKEKKVRAEDKKPRK
jgi:pyocin large subunit-like protein